MLPPIRTGCPKSLYCFDTSSLPGPKALVAPFLCTQTSFVPLAVLWLSILAILCETSYIVDSPRDSADFLNTFSSKVYHTRVRHLRSPGFCRQRRMQPASYSTISVSTDTSCIPTVTAQPGSRPTWTRPARTWNGCAWWPRRWPGRL